MDNQFIKNDFEKSQICQSFEEMGFKDEILRVIFSLGFMKPRNVQSIIMGEIIKNPEKDVLIQAPSGEGKTLIVVSTFLNQLLQKYKETGKKEKILFIYPSISLCIQQYAFISQFVGMLNEIINSEDFESEFKGLYLNVELILKKIGLQESQNQKEDSEEEDYSELQKFLSKNPLQSKINEQMSKTTGELLEDIQNNDINICTMGKLYSILNYAIKNGLNINNLVFKLLSIDEVDRIFYDLYQNKKNKEENNSLFQQLQLICQFLDKKGKIFAYSATISQQIFNMLTKEKQLLQPDALCYCVGVNEKIIKRNLDFKQVNLTFSTRNLTKNIQEKTENEQKIIEFILKVIFYINGQKKKTIIFVKEIQIIKQIQETLKLIRRMSEEELMEFYSNVEDCKSAFKFVAFCHSENSVEKNQKEIQDFLLSKKFIMVSTEGQLGRGFDPKDVEKVFICFDTDIETFIQLAGRSGRGDKLGTVYYLKSKQGTCEKLLDGFKRCGIKFSSQINEDFFG